MGASKSRRIVGKTGVVGVIRGNQPGGRSVGLRADMDCARARGDDEPSLFLEEPRPDARLRP